MGRHAAGVAHGPVPPLLRQALLIKAVAGFMENAHEGGKEFTRRVPRGHAHVGGHAAAEGVVRDIEAAMGEIKTDGFHHGFAKRLLLFDGEGGVEGLGGMPGAAFILGGEGFGDEVFQEGFEFGENRCDVSAAAAGIELLDQRIIGGEFENLAAKLGFLAGETARCLQRRGENLSSFRLSAVRARAARSAPGPTPGGGRNPTRGRCG